MSQNEATSILSFKYGDQTSIPITVRKAVFRLYETLPFVKKSLCTVELTLANTTVPNPISTKLRLQLPTDAAVKRFELYKDNQWYPATAVPNKKAAAVVYKEKEKKRAVAVTKTVASSSLFEMEVSPLPYQTDVKCRVEIMLDSCRAQTFMHSMFPASSPTEIVMEGDVDMEIDKEEKEKYGGAVVGDAFGKTHFVCKIPAPVIESTTTPREIPRVMILWDTSASILSSSTRWRSRLTELLTQGKTREVELYSFGTILEKVGLYTNAKDTIAAIEKLEYDGGSFFDSVVPFLANVSAKDDKIDCALVFSDGMDSLGNIPEVGNCVVDFPVHCIVHDDAELVNLKCLKSLASVSARFPGTVLSGKESADGYVNGVLIPQAILRSIKTDQKDESFVGEVDDGFVCVPDHRLGSIGRPIGREGILISGILKDTKDTPCAVTRLVAEVVVNGEILSYHFYLQDPNSSSVQCHAHPTGDGGPTHTKFPTVRSDNDALGAMLGHLYAEALYKENENVGLKSGMDTKVIQEELSATYGFCSPESSLLMLFEADQFVEHGILPPLGHPVRDDAKIIEMQREKESASSKKTAETVGEIGAPKNDAQLKAVSNLANRLKALLLSSARDSQPKRDPPATVPDAHQGSSRGRGGRRLSCRSSSGRNEQEVCNAIGTSWACEADSFDEGECEEEREEEQCDMMLLDASDASDSDTSTAGRGTRELACLRYSSAAMPSPASADCSEARMKKSCAPTANISKESRALTAPADPNQYMETLSLRLMSTGNALPAVADDNKWDALYRSELEKLGGYRAAVPSFFLNTARVLAKHGKLSEAIRVATNCLETGIEDVQMLRSVGYLLLSIGSYAGVNVALKVFDKVRNLAPCEPQSFLDAAMVRFWRSQRTSAAMDCAGDSVHHDIAQDIATAQELLTRVLTHRWAHRFLEIEWSALILLHFVADFVRRNFNQSAETKKLAEWPSALHVFQDCEKSVPACKHPLRCDGFDLALMVWLGWDTDKTDVDLHVKEPRGGEVCYSNKNGVGSLLSRDFTEGYGPEVYILPQCAVGTLPVVGKYEVSANYFASHQDSSLTGTTSAVVWTIEKVDGILIVKFNFVRLDTHKQRTHVATVEVEGASSR